MQLRKIDFGAVFTASGTLNFFGQGWPYHKYYKMFPGFDFTGATFISKTTTLNARDGNMPLGDFYHPRAFKPDCIKVKYIHGLVLNAVGLSGPGANKLFRDFIWQGFEKPFLISFMSVGSTRDERLKEAREFVDLFKSCLFAFSSAVGLQVNISCPNTNHPTADMIKDALSILEIVSELNIPIDLKVGVVDADLDFVKEVENSGLCDCLTCSNTIPWGRLPDVIDWKELFGSTESPLKKYGGGGLSGWPLLYIVADWLKEMRNAGITMKIKAGGGVLCADDAEMLICGGANAIEIGSVAILRPWRVQEIIQHANNLLGRK